MALAEELDILVSHRLQRTGHERHEQDAEREKQDVEQRNQERHDKRPPPDLHPMMEDDRHRVLEHGEGERAEEQQRDGQHPAHAVAVREEQRHLFDDRRRLTRDQECEQPLERRQQQRFVDEAGERNQQQDDERQDRQQRVERHGAREQEALVGAKPLEHAPCEVARVSDDPRDVA